MTGKELIKAWERAQESGMFQSYDESMAWMASEIDKDKTETTSYYQREINKWEDHHQRSIDMYKGQD